MGKGLPRSLSRADPSQFGVLKKNIAINETFDITGTASSVDAATAVIGELPEGNVLILGAVAYLQVDAGSDAEVTDNWSGDFAVGTVGVSDGAVDGTGEADIIASTALSAGSSDKLAPSTRGLFPNSSNAMTPILVDNTDGSLEINLNLLIDDNVITDTEVGTFVATGTLHILYALLGDD